MYCRNCGSEIPEDARFCPNCGQPKAEIPTTPNADVPQVVMREPGVSSGVKIFFGGCIVLPLIFVLFFIALTLIRMTLTGN